jgi:hypothetical protein
MEGTKPLDDLVTTKFIVNLKINIMWIKNYQGERDYTSHNKQYHEVVAYLVNIENQYPDLYKKLAQIPQFEYDIEICRKKEICACQYMSVLEVLVQEYQGGYSPDMEKWMSELGSCVGVLRRRAARRGSRQARRPIGRGHRRCARR